MTPSYDQFLNDFGLFFSDALPSFQLVIHQEQDSLVILKISLQSQLELIGVLEADKRLMKQ